MDTLARISTFRHSTVRVHTGQSREVLDITDQVEALVADAAIRTGLINIRCWDPLTAVTVAENEPAIGDAALLHTGAPVCLDVHGGSLQLRASQRVVLMELDGPRAHSLSMLVVGDDEQ
jgi:thiamine phosphate synthase YjbQ (UPF0047 family)